MNSSHTLERLGRERLIMVVRAASADDALRAIAAARAGGVRAVEVTFTVPDAASVIRELVAEGDESLIVGAGTVLTQDQAADALAAGARFLVSPGFDEALLDFAIRNETLMVPGIYTPSEAMRAVELGATVVKLFPAESVGPTYLKALRSPLPELRVIPSGGVTAANAPGWIAAGAVAVGMAGRLSPSGPIDSRVAADITAEARAAVAAVHAA